MENDNKPGTHHLIWSICTVFYHLLTSVNISKLQYALVFHLFLTFNFLLCACPPLSSLPYVKCGMWLMITPFLLTNASFNVHLFRESQGFVRQPGVVGVRGVFLVFEPWLSLLVKHLE